MHLDANSQRKKEFKIWKYTIVDLWKFKNVQNSKTRYSLHIGSVKFIIKIINLNKMLWARYVKTKQEELEKSKYFLMVLTVFLNKKLKLFFIQLWASCAPQLAHVTRRTAASRVPTFNTTI